jgi:hypothetical protein
MGGGSTYEGGAGGGLRPASSRRRFWAPVVAAGIVVLLVAASAAGAVELRRWNNPPAPTGRGEAQELAGLPTPGSVCRLQVADKGASADRAEKLVRYAVVVDNPCPDVAVGIQIAVYPTGSSGRRLGRTGMFPTEDTPSLPAVAPGTQTAVAGQIYAGDSDGFRLSQVTGISVHLVYATWLRAANLGSLGAAGQKLARLLAAKPTVQHVRVLKPSHSYEGNVDVGLTLHTQTPVLDAGDQTVTVVVRDRAGRILSGQNDPLVVFNRPLVARDAVATIDEEPAYVWLPKGADPSKLQGFWVPQVHQ